MRGAAYRYIRVGKPEPGTEAGLVHTHGPLDIHPPEILVHMLTLTIMFIQQESPKPQTGDGPNC